MLCSAVATAGQHELVYMRGEGALECPGPDALEQAIAAELGYSPFGEGGDEVLVEVARVDAVLTARVRIYDRLGELVGERTLTSREADCRELATAIALAIGIAIDPMGLGPASPPPEPPPDPPPPPPQVEALELAPQESAPLALDLMVSVLSSYGTAPGPSGGGAIAVRLRSADLALDLEGRAEAPRSTRVGGGKVSAGLLGGGVRGCLLRGPLAYCAAGVAGAIRATGAGLAENRKTSTAYVGLGARVAGRWAMTDTVFIAGFAEVLGSVVSTTLTVSGSHVWSNPPVTASLGLSVGAQIL